MAECGCKAKLFAKSLDIFFSSSEVHEWMLRGYFPSQVETNFVWKIDTSSNVNINGGCTVSPRKDLPLPIH